MTKEEQQEIITDLHNSVKSLSVAASSLQYAAEMMLKTQKTVAKPTLSVVKKD